MIFVDTGGWFARFVPDDPNHANVQSWFRANHEPLVTTDYCVDETLTLLVARKRPKLAMEAGRSFFDEQLARLLYVSPEHIRRAWILFQRSHAAGWSFTDCTSKIRMDDLSIESALAFDEHFGQFGKIVIRP